MRLHSTSTDWKTAQKTSLLSRKPWFLRPLVSLILVSLFATFLPITQVAEALTTVKVPDAVSTVNPGGGLEEIRSVGSVETRYGLVTILVDEDTWNSQATGSSGLFSFLGSTSIDQKIETYAEDIQSALPWTKAMIVTVSEDDTPVEILHLLEELYFQGNPEDDDATKLTGVVAIGDVPLPVVNKNGHRFISMLPYTDFEAPAYLLDDTTQDFVPNTAAQNMQAEAWHGLIVPPVDGSAGIDLLAEFFDKNHAFHSGDEDATTFDQKALVTDFVTEEATVNGISFDSYERFTEIWEEMTYYQYTNDLLEEMYVDMMSTMEEGDFLDNDLDGETDEEAANGRDDDGDGLIDEDLGDGFYGIDNDEDGAVDEDSDQDNNNDADWVIEDFWEDDLPDFYHDMMVDEDPPGDANGDGCPGVCGVDDNGFSEDHDGDGYPTAWEVLYGYPWDNDKKPYKSVRKMVDKKYNVEYETDEEATAFLQEMFIDGMYSDYYQSDTCKDSSGNFHPEWDDDEDGFCDEDGSTEMQLWLNAAGYPASGNCAYNDADCDGQIDEDPVGMRPDDTFELIPDMQSKTMIEELINRYAEIFEKPLGVWNRVVNQTGRYKSRYTDEDGNIANDYDTAVSLISKKDEEVLLYLGQEVNPYFENGLDEIVEDLQKEIPMVAVAQITGYYYPYESDGSVGDPVEICDEGASPDVSTDACIQFVNHSTTSPGKSFDRYNIDWETNNVKIYGENLYDIEDPSHCTIFAGTDEEGGQKVQFNTMYSPSFTDIDDRGMIDDMNNCVPDYAQYKDDIPEVCSEPTVELPIRALDGTIDADIVAQRSNKDDSSEWETGFEACFEFREMHTFEIFEDSYEDFNDWLSKQIRRFRKEAGSYEDMTYEEFLVEVENEKNKATPVVGTATLQKNYDELDILASDASATYTVTNMLEDFMGWTGALEPSNDQIDTFIGVWRDADDITIDDPQFGTGMSGIAQLEITLDKLYIDESTVGTSSPSFTTRLSDAYTIPSMYKHVEPTPETLSAQVQSPGAQNLPIDKTRRVSFLDEDDTAQYCNYINVFDAETLTDVNVQLKNLAEEVAAAAGGSSYRNDVINMMDGVNEDQLADALAWMNMNIDEKHEYVLSHYLGEDYAINSESLDGYEMVSMVADGTATQMHFGFNGAAPEAGDDGDLMWLYRSQEAIDAALAAAASTAEPEYEPVGGNPDMQPVLLSEWLEAIQEWIEDTKTAASSFKTYDGGTECGDISQFAGSNDDDDGNGMPDGADGTFSIRLTSDDNDVLQAGGKDYYVVTVSAYNARGFTNTEDSYTEVELEILSGDGVVEVSGNDTLKLTGGTATFALVSGDAGNFTVRATPVNRSDLGSSNTLSGSVKNKFVAVTTYVREAAGTDAEVVAGDKVEVFDDDGNLLAILDPETGDLELRIVDGERASAQILEATQDKPTRFAVMHGGATYAVFFLIPSIKEAWVGSGIDGVFVREIADFVEADKEGSGTDSIVYLYDTEPGDGASADGSDGLMGAVNAYGQIAVSDSYYLEFENPGELNIYDPIHIYNGDGEDLFTVTIGHSFSGANLSAPEDEHNGFLSWLDGLERGLGHMAGRMKVTFVQVAKAAGDALDSDDDSLSDLEEWTIGTDLNDPDTDSDGYPDGEEIFAGYSPLNVSSPLFTDLSPNHEAFNAVVELYLRGIVSGYADGSFLPDQNMTREEFVKVNLGSICVACTNFSSSMTQELMSEYLQDPFPDADINPDLLPCVAYAKDAGIVSGYEGGELDGYFLPGRYISRAEAVKVLVETAELSVAAAESGDVWYAPYVDTAMDNNIFSDESEVTTTWLEGNITRGEFAMMAVNLLASQDCRSIDGDGDGLSDTEEEMVYGTDPDDTDTDGGGVSDFDEVIRGSDPLDADDDFPGEDSSDGSGDNASGDDGEDFSFLSGFTHDAGLYAIAEDENASFEEISVVSGDGEAIMNVFTNKIPADGKSVLFVKAEIRDQAGNVYVEDNTSVIEFILSTAEHGNVQSSRVQVSNGQAETTFVTTEVAGDVSIEARITDGSLPSEDTDVRVYPGDPVRLSVSSESNVLPAGGEATTDVRVSLYDSFGNLANNGFYGVTLSADGGMQILDLNDENGDLEGIQVTTPDGYIDFRVLASATAGTARVLASLTDDASADGTSSNIYSASIEHIDGMQITLTPEREYMFAGGSRTQNVAIAVTDRIGRTVTGFQGDVYLSMSDPGYASFTDDNGMGQKTVSLTAGEGSAELSPGTLAGLGSIIAESTGIQAGSASLEIKPSEAYELRIREENDLTVLSAGKNVRFYVDAYDVYGNLVTTDSSTRGEIRLTTATADFATLSTDEFVLNQGSAAFTLRTEDISGVLNLVATSGDLLAGTWSGEIDFSLSGEDFEDIDPAMLYGSLLGGPFGDVTQEDYIAGWMTFNGKTQAMTSLISEPVPKKRLVSIDADGAVSIPDESLVTQTVQGAGSKLPVRLQWRSFPDDTLIGEVFYVAPTADEAIAVELLTARYDLEVDSEDDGSVVLREKGAAAVKIRDDGQIVLMDPNYSLVVNADTDGLGFIVMRTTEQVMRVDFDVQFSSVELVNSDYDLEGWDSKSAGIYLRPTAATENAIVSIPTGNSSLSPMGLAIIDPDEDLPKSMQPSLGYTSLESAESDGNVGWENENKHLLLFAAGNTVGQANLFYPSEVGVVLGDPTVSVQTQTDYNALGYTKDVGTMVSASQDEILTLMDIDYNDDGMEDVLVAYENGLVEVLQNFKAPVRLQKEGALLYVENGISEIDSGDFNNDGLEDIFVVAQESCYADEMCMYIYENIGGGFVAHNLTLSGISGNPTQVVVADLNNDDYSDLVIADENLKLYVVWNAEGTLETVDEIEDFGLREDSGTNLYGEVALRYSGIENEEFSGTGSTVSLSIPDTELDVDSINSDLEAMLAAISGNPDYEFNLNGESSGELERMVDAKFEYGDLVDTYGELDITKRLDDDDGGRIEVGDLLTYTINVENVTSGNFSDFYLTDSLAGSFDFTEGSVTAEFVLADGTDEVVDGDVLADYMLNGDSVFPWILGPFSLAAGEELTVTYEATVSSLPSLTILVDHDFYDDYKDDNYLDIGVSMEGNSTGVLMVYYSDGYITESSGGRFGGVLGGTSYRRINYNEMKYVPEDYEEEASTEPDSPFEDADGDGTPDFIQNMDPDVGMPVPAAGTYDPFAEIFGASDVDGDGYYSTEEMFQSDDDVDGDGIPDIIDLFVGELDMMLDPSLDLDGSDDTDGESVRLSSEELTIEGELSTLNEQTDAVVQVVEDIVSAFTCNGGCIAFPGSISFLTPGAWHDPFTGTTFGFDQGFPIFGLMPNPPYVCTGPSCFATSTFRLYLSPTTTLGLGLGICVSVYGTPLNCMAFNIPLLQMLGVCDAINGFITDSLSTVSSFVSNGNTSTFNIDSSSGSDGEPNGLSSAIFDAYVPPVATNKNVQVPGFPSIFTEWWKAQKNELFKMLDLPDITVIYPKIESVTTGGSFEYEKESKLEAMTGSVLGLENLLNTLNALPLIDINPEPVYIHYPWLTPEEIDLAEREFEQWETDFENEWDRFKKQFEVTHGGQLSPSEWEAYYELEDAVEEIRAAIAANRAVLESYRDIPREILEIRTLQADYLKTIVCYLDAILSHTAGYLSENVNRAEAWAQWAVDLRGIVDGWRIIIDSSVNMMDSCDKCTNQRWNAMQLIFSLFAFMPEFPVVELPKLPDIILDVSNIQAGLDIAWPDLNFVAETVSIPELPRVVFPSVYLDTSADLDISIPVLPEFPVSFDAPELPGLTLPDLPSIPPPPAIPEIDPSIQAAVSILSNVLKVVCIIRNGFVPVNETSLKTKIEDLTERSSSFVLPFDLAITADWPSFSFDFVERIEIRTYLNLVGDLSGFYDLFTDLGDQSNEITGTITSELSEAFQDVVDQLEGATVSLEDIELEIDASIEADVDLGEGSADAGASGELESYIHPAIETALKYKDHPLVHDNLIALENVLEELSDEFAAWDEEMPDSYDLVAEEIVLAANDPLLHRYDEIIDGGGQLDASFIAQIQDSPLADVASLRESLITYVNEFDSTTRKLDGMDENMFTTYLAQESQYLANSQFMLASDGEDGNAGFSGADSWDLEEQMTTFDGSGIGDINSAEDAEVMLAEEGDTGTTGTGGDWDTSSAQTYNDGIYIYNPQEAVAERLINYTQESDEASSILFIDIDNDGDDDIVYSMGGDVYIKENYLDNPSERYNGSDPQITSLTELAPKNGAVHNFKRGTNGYEEASFSFSAAEDATGYEVIFYDSLDASIAEPDENLKRLLLLADEENDSAVFYDSEGNEYKRGTLMVAGDNSAVFQGGDELSILVPSGGEFNLPDIAQSRLIATDVSGNVVIQNGVKRTRIKSSGELETSDDIILQTTEETLLKVEIDGKTTNIELPAHYLIDLGSKQDRTVRVDSGEVFWIQPEETVAEQDLEEGMEIFEDELVLLDSMLAKATLQTSEGAEIKLDKREVFIMDGLSNAASPNSQISLENGLFYTLVRGIFADGSVGTISEMVTLNPQVCADKNSPYAILDSSMDLAIFASTEVSAESSFDTDSEIVDAYWDLDASVDANGDGILNNDEEILGLTAEIGPYTDTDPKEVTLWITDAAGNQDSATMTVNIYVPDLEIASANPAEVSGTTDPASPYFPFYLVREREGAVSELGGVNYTDEYGDFLIDDLDSSDLLSVYDSNGNIVAQFNPATLQLIVYSDAYEATVLPAESKWPTRLAVFEKSSGLIIGSFLIVSNENRVITQMAKPLENYDLSLQSGVTVYVDEDAAAANGGYDVNDFEVLGRDTLGNLEITISNTGNIVIYDPTIEIVKREAESLDEQLIIEVYDDGELEMEIWPGNPGNVQIVYTGDLNLPASGTVFHDSLSADARLYFEDIATTDELYENIAELVERGVLQGYAVSGKRYFLPNESINRAEFAKIILGILCIVPTDEAYAQPNVFSDILDTAEWFYPYTKEAFLHELITGYLGEVDANGMAPFKPENTITRAEAAKIVLEALDAEGIIELPSDDELTGEPWYEPYLAIAQDLSPYMISGATAGAENFILTSSEARDPAHVLTRYEFVEISVRVLQAYNCFDLDTDGDGLINFDEESIYGTDPYNPDTDAGGVDDGTEVERGTDPLYSADDFEDDEFDIDSGIYAVRETCYSCPCSSNIDFAADLKYGDKVFGIIRNAAGEIFGISNIVEITE